MTSEVQHHRGKVLIFITTHQGTEQIPSSLNDLPAQLFDPVQFHILILSDGDGRRQGSPLPSEIKESGRENVTVFANRFPIGYGAAQKIGYQYAIENGFGFVIYLPELQRVFSEDVSSVAAALKSGEADIALPSSAERSKRMGRRESVFQRVAKRFLQAIEKHVCGFYTSTFQWKMRGYRVDFLSRVPFELNTDADHFDVEILLQASALGAPMVQIPLRSTESDSPDHVITSVFLSNFAKACLKFRFQKIGFFCTMQYRGLLRQDSRYSDKSNYWGSSHQRILSRLRTPAKVLDLGCGPGHVSKKLKELGCFVVGVDETPASHYPGDRFIQLDLEHEKLPENISAYDYVLLLDVLEHLSDPERFLIKCRYSTASDKQPTFLMSTGNVAFIGVRALLGLGFFTYGERGILDVTHKRLFTLHSFRRMLQDTGYEIKGIEGVGVPFQLVFPGFLGRFLGQCSSALAQLRPSLFGYQIIIEARPKPHSFMLLSQLKD